YAPDLRDHCNHNGGTSPACRRSVCWSFHDQECLGRLNSSAVSREAARARRELYYIRGSTMRFHRSRSSEAPSQHCRSHLPHFYAAIQVSRNGGEGGRVSHRCGSDSDLTICLLVWRMGPV